MTCYVKGTSHDSLNEKIREVKNPKKDRDVPPVPSVSSGNAPKTPTVSKVVPSNTSDSRNAKRKDMPTSSPSPTYVPLSRIYAPWKVLRGTT